MLIAVASGNRDSFAEFYDRTCDRVYGLIIHMIDDQRRSEEVTRRTYAEVWGTASRYRVECLSPTAWVLLLAHRLAVTEMRSHTRENVLSVAGGSADGQESRTGDSDVTLQPFWPTAEHRERRDLYRSYYRAMTFRQIAQADDIPVEVVRSRMKSALLAVHLHYLRTASALSFDHTAAARSGIPRARP
ncbi:sigma factor-like helix-turn-helix DNA-binding protein [Rhodococcus sp. C3V]|uniref:sigma factor-like helix-turn-helix DNA-binding protein n=1 Tax=Rhodococcus sp. C3V TaxID=3034165 RepID=UPI0023E327F0|nr:sigma factor-like helix-turn-helix DNA-binding protein [Rhodococcus sp. C3V]MDF3319711.1 sigma factor-like helix-turn-helix DNA-binding protein [Rhodococcus sp. C3V]